MREVAPEGPPWLVLSNKLVGIVARAHHYSNPFLEKIFIQGTTVIIAGGMGYTGGSFTKYPLAHCRGPVLQRIRDS